MTEPVVFLPELMCDARLFWPQVTDLSRDHAVMVAPITSGERIEEIASSVLDALPTRCALAGLGLGGIIAMEIYRRAPERVTRLALMDTSPLADTPQVSALRDPLIIRARTGRLDEVLTQELTQEDLAPSPYRKEVMALYSEMGLGLGVEVYVRQARALQRRRDQQGTLRRITVPTLVLCGERDNLCPVKRHNFMAEMIPKARLCIVEDAGHLPVLEQPETVNRAIREWLAEPLLLR